MMMKIKDPNRVRIIQAKRSEAMCLQLQNITEEVVKIINSSTFLGDTNTLNRTLSILLNHIELLQATLANSLHKLSSHKIQEDNFINHGTNSDVVRLRVRWSGYITIPVTSRWRAGPINTRCRVDMML